MKANPAADLDLIELGHGQRPPGRWLTPSDAARLLEACVDGTDQGERDHALICTAMLAGLRRAELARLRWRDIDLAQRRISVKGKGGKLATIGMAEQAATSIHRWRETVIGSQGHKPRPDDPVFCTGRPQGGLRHSERLHVFDWRVPLSLWGIRKVIARRAEDAGLGVVATHDLRRTFAGFLDEQGVDLGGIQAALRHSSPDVTNRCYLEPSPRRAVRAVAELRIEGLS